MEKVALSKEEQLDSIVAGYEKKVDDLYPEIKFFSSGSTLLDLALGGGWALGRVFNIVGDKSSGKTLLAIEAFANFTRTFPNGRMRYAEAEAAFDDAYAATLGFPPNVERPKKMIHTVQEFAVDLFTFAEKGGPSLYILDSLDALSSDTEVENFETKVKGKEAKGSMGTEKAKGLSEMFRSITCKMGEENCTLGIISQIRDRIGVMFGDHYARSGGHALSFYATHELWLAETGKLKRSVKGNDHVIGVSIHSKVKKNKVGVPHKTADYPLIFNYGVDDETSMIEWLTANGSFAKEAVKECEKRIKLARETQNYATLKTIRAELRQDTTRIWKEIEETLRPKVRKYE